VASGFSGRSAKESKYKRIQRFFRFFPVDRDLISRLLASMLPIKGEAWTLTIDRTNWKFGELHINILLLGVAYKGIAFPIMWVFLNKKRGNSNTKERIELIERFLKLFGIDKIKCLTADREFIGEEWLRYLLKKKIPFRIRVRNNTQVAKANGMTVDAKNLFREIKTNECLVLEGKRKIWGLDLFVCGLLLPDGEYLIVVTDKNPDTAISDYARRWEIETLFGCLKTRGFCFESTHLKDYKRIDKLLSLISIAFCWAHIVGEWCNSQKPIRIKKHGRRAQSIFRYGYDHLRDILLNIREKTEDFKKMLEFLFCLREHVEFIRPG